MKSGSCGEIASGLPVPKALQFGEAKEMADKATLFK
jgi:hypothetical protein